MRRLILSSFLIILFCLSCYSGEAEIPFTVPITEKTPPQSEFIFRVAAYIDTSRPTAVELLENIGRYTIRPRSDIPGRVTSDVPYFDFVVLGGARMVRGNFSPWVEMDEGLSNILRQRNTLLRPLQNQGIRILLGVEGGGDGVAFGTLPREMDQMSFARMLHNICVYYRLDGVEFNDVGAEGSGLNPYPELETTFFNGEDFIWIRADGTTDHQNRHNRLMDIDALWSEGGGHMIDMMSYVIEFFGAAGTDGHGDHTPEQLKVNPILLRESNFGAWITQDVPRFPFTTSMVAFAFLINSCSETFGFEDTGRPNEQMRFVDQRRYGPVIFDLATITAERLEEFSDRLGRDGGAAGRAYRSEFGIVYYTNLDAHATGPPLSERLSVTSRHLFGAEVRFE